MKLLCTNGLRALYVALSHCWGGKIETVLLKDKLQDFQHSLQLDGLAANFQDAIAVTKSLNIRYLLIDSLCIIQDSKGDWATESKKMGLIYRDSIITRSAMASPGSRRGILRSSGNASCADPTPAQLAVYPRTDPRTDIVRGSATALTRRTSTVSTHMVLQAVMAGVSKSPFCHPVSSTLVSDGYTGGALRVFALLMALCTKVKSLQTVTLVYLVHFIQT